MNYRWRVSFGLALIMGVLVPPAWPQKPPAPPPAPPASPSPGAGGPVAPNALPNSDVNQQDMDLVLYLRGRVATSDGTSLPNDVMIERWCNSRVRQQVYASVVGDFSMQLGSMADSFVDASGEGTPQFSGSRQTAGMGIPRRDLANCELRASVSGFHSSVVNLMEFTASGKTIDIGAIVVQRAVKVKGETLSALPYQAPKDARRAYEKGLEAEKNAKLPDARKYFEQAVALYPKYTSAWFQLGGILQKENQKDEARKAYVQATAIDTRFLPPYLALAKMAFETQNWQEAVKLTGHIIGLDPLNRASIAGYIVDLDSSSCAEAYFYNAFANFKLDKYEDAEKSALKADQHVDVHSRFPQLHLLLGEIYVQKNDYPSAVSELRTYLELVPHATDSDLVRQRLAKLEKQSASGSTGQKINQD